MRVISLRGAVAIAPLWPLGPPLAPVSGCHSQPRRKFMAQCSSENHAQAARMQPCSISAVGTHVVWAVAQPMGALRTRCHTNAWSTHADHTYIMLISLYRRLRNTLYTIAAAAMHAIGSIYDSSRPIYTDTKCVSPDSLLSHRFTKLQKSSYMTSY